jgi:predicted enzyme related to lactoylglutathione lyase
MRVSAVLFAKDLRRTTDFYAKALCMTCTASDEYHSRLDCHGFDLVIQQIPSALLRRDSAELATARRDQAAMRLNFPLSNIEEARRSARALGGEIDTVPPPWAGTSANIFLGHDPEGNVFMVCEPAAK